MSATYWLERGKTFESEALAHTDWGAEDGPLMELLGELAFESVLEIGCGFGRVGEMIAQRWPDVRYTGLDVSPDLIAAAQRRLPDAEFICADLTTWDTERTWDLVLSVIVLSHIPPVQVAHTVAKVRRWARRDIVAVEWDERGKATDYEYGHHYGALFGPTATRTLIANLALYHLALA